MANIPIPQILKDNRKVISALKPEKQEITYRVKNWDRYFANDTAYKYVSGKYKNQITRGDIFTMGKNLRADYSLNGLKEFFISIMLWGFGTTGYGAYRTERMVLDGNFRNIIKTTYKNIEKGNIQEAYNSFRLATCGSAFFTKFFYFSGKGNGNVPMPLILDTVVARSLEEKCKLDISLYARVTRNKKKGNQISSVNRYADGYINYLQDMNNWAGAMNVTPDKIELFLFS